MATVDTLEIQIQTSAESTNAALDRLAQRLTVVEKNLKNVGNTSNSSFNNMKKMASSFSAFSSTTNKSNIRISSLANSLGKMYLRVQTLKKGFGTLSDSINNSIGYFENLNYFTKAFEQVAQKADYSSFEEMGYASAEEYAASFMKRANQLTAKMTGFSINTDGMLEDTGGVSLGLNPSDLITQQATFSQMASSMGTTSEQALKLSNVLTMLGADLASVKNMDFNKVWTDMQSGLAGMSRTMDKYGANIRLVNLQLLLNKLGIEQSVSALNQNEKALLRTIAILDATRYSWGDLSETLNQPANQIRVLTANFENLGRMIGNLFVPMISKALPYINGIVIALQRLVTQISEFVGIDLSGITSSVGNVDISGMLGTDEAEEDVNDVTNAVKKLKSTTLGIDELNINAPQGESGGVGLGGIDSGKLNDAFNSIADEYTKVWNDAFAQMNNKSKEFADKIEKIFEPLAKPLKDLFKSISIGDWFGAGQNVSNIVSGIFDLFSIAIKKVDWKKIGNSIGKFLEGINWIEAFESVGKFMWEGINASFDLYKETFNAAPLETALITAIAGLSFSGVIKVLLGKLKNVILSVFASLVTLFTSAEGLIYFFSSASSGMIGQLGIYIEQLLEGTFLDTKTWTGIPKKINDFINGIIDFIGVGIEKLALGLGTLISDLFNLEETYALWNDVVDNFKAGGVYILHGIVEALMIIPYGIFEIAKNLTSIIYNALKDFFSKLYNTCCNIIGAHSPAEEFKPIGEYILLGIIEGIINKFYMIYEAVENFFSTIWNALCDVLGIHSPAETMKPIGENILLGIVKGFIDNIFVFNDTMSNFFKNTVSPWFDVKKWANLGINASFSLLDGISKGFSDKNDEVKGNARKSGNAIVDGLLDALNLGENHILNKCNSIVQNMQDIFSKAQIKASIGATIGANAIISNVNIPQYAVGGFPEDGLFMANHSELVGQFTNGRTAVANNDQIIEGIKEGVKEAVGEMLTPYLAYLPDIAQSNREVANKDMSVNIGDREIARANARGQKSLGYALIT